MLAEVMPLLKKDISESINNFKAKRGALGVFGYVVYFVLLAALVLTATFLYSFVANSYINISSNLQLIYLRQKELLTITLTLIFLFNVFSGVVRIYKKIVINADMDKLSVLPISSKNLFIYKIIYIFVSQFVSNLITILTFGICFGVVCQMGVLYYFMMVLAILIFPFISMGVSALLVVPYYYFVKFTHSKYFLLILIYAVLFAVAFLLYSIFLEAINNILVSGGLKNFFNEQTFKVIEKIARFAYPCNLIANLMLGENVLLNLLIVGVFGAICVSLLFVIVAKCYPYLSSDSMEESSVKFVRKVNFQPKGVFHTLLNKEFVSIFRNSNYAFSLFSVSLTLPILVFLCTRLLSLLVMNIVYVNINYIISLFVVSMFALLTNTFCASNISREGKNFYKQMLMPLTNFQILLPKVFACFIVSSFAIVVSCLALTITGYLTVPQGLFVAFVVIVLCLAENLFATKHDLIKPSFATNKKGEMDTETSSSNLVVIVSFVTTILVIGSILLYNVLKVLKGQVVSFFVIYILPGGIALLLLVLAIVYFTYKLNKIKMVEK